MADGNIGNLFVSLGIKDEMSNALQKIIKEMKGVDQATQDAKKRGEELVSSLNSINGNNFSKVFRDANEYIEKNSKGVSGIVKMLNTLKAEDLNALTSKFLGARNFTNIASILRTANAELEKMSGNEDKAGNVKIWQSKISNALDYIKLLQDINEQQKKISNTKSENPNVDTKSLDNARKSLSGIRSEIVGLLSSGGIDDANVLKGFQKLLSVAKKDVKDIVSTFKKDNVLSNFSGGAAKVEADIARVTEKLAKMRDLMSEGTQKGYSTSMLTGSISELDNILTRLNAAKLNPTMLTDAAQMRNLISDVLVEMVKATAATQAYGREKGKVIAQEKAAAEEYDRQRRQRDAAKKAQDEELKALSDYAKRYMELQEAKIKADKKASDERKRQSEAEARRIEADTERMSRLYAKMSLVIGRGERASMRGLELGVNTSALEKALSEATELKRRIEDANIALMGKGGRPSYSSYAEEVNRLSSSLANATQAQRDLNSAQDKANRKAEAQAIRDAAKAKRDDAAAERQRQREIEISTRRTERLDDVLVRLRKEYGNSVKLQVDTTQIETKIKDIENQFNYLKSILQRLGSRDSTALGLITNVGDQREVQLANRVADAQREANREAQRGIELEQKRQQAIVDSGAKIQSQLVRGFEKANSHAGKLNSTVQDLKSLFLQGGLVFGAQQFAMSIITTGGEMEKQHIALQSILGDMQNANTMFNQIKELALNSPFTFSELNRDVKQLAAYGVEYEQLYDTTKRLADMSSGLGVSFDRIALAFGQVQARGWLDGKELRQIAYAGIPLLEKLSEFYSKQEGRNVSTSEIKTRISSRDVSFDDVKSIFWQMTDAGGQFYNMQQVLSETLLGRYNKLKDAWEIMLADFANGKNVIGGTFKGILDVVTNLVQQIHVLGPAMVAAFAGPALMRGVKTLEGGIGKRILNSKGNIAKEAELKLLRGEKITPVEKQILQYKNQIRIQDIQALAKANAITKAELRRLYVTGQITKEMYKQGMALTKQEGQVNRISLGGVLKGLASPSKWGAAGGLLLGGLKSGFSSIIGFLGGLPGIAISAGSAIFAYYWQKHQQLKQDMETTADELKDRYTKIGEFIRDNDADKAIKDGDEKEIENLIDAYKEKLKEIAPEKENAFTMSILEKKSNEDRLKYLKEQLILLKQVEESTQKYLSNEDTYKGFDEKLSSAKEIAEAFSSASAKANMVNATQSDFANLNSWEEKYKDEVKAMRNYLINELGDISNSPELQGKANQILSSFFAKQGWNQDVSDQFRADVLNAMGVETGFYENKFKDALDNAVNTSFPWIGDKIRNNQELTDAEKVQVSNMMKDAAAQVQKDYPFASDALKRMLAADRFEAVIHLVFRNDDSDLTQQLEKNLKGSGYDYHEKNKYVKSWGKDAGDDYDKAKSNAESDITAAKKELNTRKKMLALGNLSLDEFTQKQKEYELKMQAYHDNWGEWFTGDDKKKNKYGKNNNAGRKEDTELKRLQERLSSLKSARQMYQKYKSIMSDEEAKKKTYNLFPEVTGLDLDDYHVAVTSLLGGFKINTPERKKFQTSVRREDAEWEFEEKDKVAFTKKAADLNESMNKLSERWDLYKRLLEKTGSKFFAESAWIDAFQMDDKTQSLMDEYYANYHEIFNLQNSLNMTDGEAKEKLKQPNQYEEWKKITELLRGNYVKSLQDAADIIEKTEDYEDKILKIRERYNELISKTNDPGIKARYEIQRDKEIGQVKLDKFKNSSDYLNFYGAIVSLGMDKAQTIGERIRQNINEALQSGAIDAREYAKEIKQLDEQLSKLTNPRKTFLNGGLKGMAEQKISDASEQMTIAASKIADGKRIREEGLKKGDLGKIAKGDYLIASGESMMKAANILFKDGTKAKESIDKFANVVSIIDQNVQGMSEAFNDVKETASLLGVDTESDGWQDASAFFDSLSGMSSSMSKAVTSAASGNVGGVIAGVTGIFTSPIKAFAKAHDAKLDRQIKLAERQLNELKNLSSNINSVIEKTLGGIYSYERSSDTTKKLNDVKNDYRKWDAFSKTKSGKNFFGGHNFSHYSKDTYDAVMKTEKNPSAYADQLALLHAQEDELRKQRQAEEDKKKTDKDKLADYDQQIKEMELQIKTFAQDFLKDIYSIDMKSWASTLTDTIVSAWAKGEDAVDSYKKKVKDMVRDVTKNIVSQKIMEKALEEPLKWLTGILDKKGKLDETDMNDFADKLYQVGENVVPQLTGIFDALKEKGLDLRENGSSSTTNSIKGITEETADILASYLNAVRLDVSVIREMQGKFLPEMSEIAKSQLTQLNLIARNTLRNADAAERIEKIFIEYNDNFNRVINGTKSLKMK